MDLVSRLVLEYDGSGFCGWARQPGDVRTVEAELTRALSVLLGGAEVPLTVAGRTDTGVHALGQVASYEGPAVRVAGLNALLPDDVAVLACEQADDDFDARRSATSRAYMYRVLARGARSAVWRGRAWHRSGAVDVDRLRACAAALDGTHDFTAFTPTDTYHVRFSRDVFSARWREAAELAQGMFEFTIEADTFMRQMNRVLVGTMIEVALGKRTVDEFRALLRGAPRSEAGMTAPPHGLYLLGVGYAGRRVLAAARRDR